MKFFNNNIAAKLSIATVVMSVFMAFPFADSALGAVRAYSGGSNVNLRQAPVIESEIIGSVREKQELTIIEKSGGFMKLSTDSGEAYISAEFVVVYNDDGIVNGTNVNVRSLEGNVVGQLNKGDKITISGIAGDMLRFTYNGALSFVHKDFVDSEFVDYLVTVEGPVNLPFAQMHAVVTSNTVLNLRSMPDTSSSIITKLRGGEALDIIENNGAWVKVKTADNKEGYVSAEFVEIRTGARPEKPVASSKGAEIVAFAKQYLGTPYVYGGTNLNKGVDCSGFIYSVYKNFGITLNRTSYAMPANGVKVDKSELVAGDLVFFSNGGAKNIQHAGIYCGDGTFIHSATGGARRVIISRMNEAYYVRNYITAARILK